MLATTEGRSDMQIHINGRNIPVTEALERYAWEKVERIARFFDDERTASRAEVELIHERNRAISEPEAPEAVPEVEQPFVVEEEEEIATRIVRTKQFQMKPMGAEEAVLQLELLDHDFYVFTSADTGDINVVYRRRDGNYGLIEPAR